MKKLMLLAAGIATFLLAACTTPNIPVVPPAQAAAMEKAQIAKACLVVQPTLLSVQALTIADPAQQIVLKQLVQGNAALCAANEKLDTATMANLVNTSIPGALQVVAVMPLDPATKIGIQIGLIAFQTALSAAIMQYGTPEAPAPASAPASTPAVSK